MRCRRRPEPRAHAAQAHDSAGKLLWCPRFLKPITPRNPGQPPTLTTETIGGKSVTVATNPGDDVEYFYISGEWAWFLDNAERSHVETIFGALP